MKTMNYILLVSLAVLIKSSQVESGGLKSIFGSVHDTFHKIGDDIHKTFHPNHGDQEAKSQEAKSQEVKSQEVKSQEAKSQKTVEGVAATTSPSPAEAGVSSTGEPKEGAGTPKVATTTAVPPKPSATTAKQDKDAREGLRGACLPGYYKTASGTCEPPY